MARGEEDAGAVAERPGIELHEHVRAALRRAGRAALEAARAARTHPVTSERTHWRLVDGRWQGTQHIERHKTLDVFAAWRRSNLVLRLDGAIASRQPGLRWGDGPLDARRLIEVMLRIAPAELAVDAAADAAVQAIESELRDGTQLDFHAPLHGVEVEADRAVELPGGILLRRVDESIANRWYSHTSGADGIPSACFEATYRSFAGADAEQVSAELARASRRAARAMTLRRGACVAMRSWSLRARSVFGAAERTWSEPGVARGSYTLADRDVDPLQRLATELETELDPSVDQAIDRLFEASLRESPRDGLLDAISALEALILPSGAKERSFRFAVHFGAIGRDPLARLERYREARDLYQLRGDILARRGDRDVDLRAVGAVAREHLRETIQILLRVPSPRGPERKRAQFWERWWERMIFGVYDG